MSGIASVFDEMEAPPTPPTRKPRARKPRPQDNVRQWVAGAGLEDFYAYMPGHAYLYVPTRELWPAASVNGRISPWPVSSANKKIKPSDWLDRNRPIEQMVWDPSEAAVISGRVMQISGYARHESATVFNLYRPPDPLPGGDAAEAGPWWDHLRRIYPHDADHIEKYLAFKVQNPGVKVNHSLVIGGAQGIGKDTILAPVRAAVGPWNCQDVTPPQMLGRFNGWTKCVLLVVSEARDLGDLNRFAFYDHSKVYLAAPPDVVRVDEKNLREHYVVNVCGVIFTTNNRLDGLYLPADDRRHYVAWSDATREQFEPGYWSGLYGWYAAGGIAHVAAHLRTVDISSFDPKAPPPKTAAFWAMVQANEAPESGELRDLIDYLQQPPTVTLDRLVAAATSLTQFALADELKDRKARRSIPHKLDRVGYAPVRNPDATDGLFKIAGKRQAVYAMKTLSLSEQITAARRSVE
jgi:hypothetical protein